MPTIADALSNWRSSLCTRIEFAGLVARNPTAHKWKAPFRSLVLRETVFWRIQDLLAQSYVLHLAHHTLGARILLRSALETLATLIHLNQITSQVLNGKLDFHAFSARTSRLLLGSRDESTKHESISIITVLKHCEKAYPGIEGLYATLSETAHPNFEGMCFGYSRVDDEKHISELSNNMCAMYEDKLVSALQLCMSVFEREYNNEWPALFQHLEDWIASNDEMLEATKRETDV
jgi:hypothetical protein